MFRSTSATCKSLKRVTLSTLHQSNTAAYFSPTLTAISSSFTSTGSSSDNTTHPEFLLFSSLTSPHSSRYFHSFSKLHDREDDSTSDENDASSDNNNSLANNSSSSNEKLSAAENAKKLHLQSALKPKEIVGELDRFIVGQRDAKRAVANALRNRWRRHQLNAKMRDEVIPKNILMIGPTGSGKTEVARRLAKLAQAPFIKVEATKFTEVGFHGRDVDSIIRDLVDISINQTKKQMKKRLREKARNAAADKIVEAMTGRDSEKSGESFKQYILDQSPVMMKRTVTIDLPEKPKSNRMPFASMGGNEFVQVGDISQLFGGGSRTKRETMRVSDAFKRLEEAELEKLLETEEVTRDAIKSVEEDGIVFIDEIDKICSGRKESHDASAEGVQRDLLPLIEGTTIATKHGNVKTDHILFIASGAFSSVKPADMLAELQGRLPIRVELKGLTENDMYRILKEPEYNIIRQQKELLKTEDVELEFTDDAVRAVARIAFEVNNTIENLGARRLHTVVERILDEISFNAPEKAGETITITPEMVEESVKDLLKRTDLSKFII